MLTFSESRDQQWLAGKLSVGAWHHKHGTSPRRIRISSITFLPPPSASSPALQNTDRQTDRQTKRETQRETESATAAGRGRRREQQRGGVQSSAVQQQQQCWAKRAGKNVQMLITLIQVTLITLILITLIRFREKGLAREPEKSPDFCTWFN
jgi:hypothetical protein